MKPVIVRGWCARLSRKHLYTCNVYVGIRVCVCVCEFMWMYVLMGFTKTHTIHFVKRERTHIEMSLSTEWAQVTSPFPYTNRTWILVCASNSPPNQTKNNKKNIERKVHKRWLFTNSFFFVGFIISNHLIIHTESFTHVLLLLLCWCVFCEFVS